MGEGGSHLLYFAVLLLTGQLERAIHVLFKSNEHRVHSIHIALLADQLRLLLCTPKCSDEICEFLWGGNQSKFIFINFSNFGCSRGLNLFSEFSTPYAPLCEGF